MTYTQALQVIQTAAAFLEANDGNLTSKEYQLHMFALEVAYEKVTAAHKH